MNYHAEDWFQITGRGKLAVITDHGLKTREDVDALRYTEITIDGTKYLLTGVEVALDLLQGLVHGPVGFLVKEIDEQDGQDPSLSRTTEGMEDSGPRPQ